MKLHLNNANSWERLCSLEYDSSTTTVTVSAAKSIDIETNPPRHLLEIALRKLSQIIKLSTNLSRIQLDVEYEPLDRVIAAVCEALIHSRVQQKVQVEFVFLNRMTCEQFLPIANLMRNCKREIGVDIACITNPDDEASDLFADALRHLACAVTYLRFGIDNDAACALAENLTVNTTLTHLCLSVDKIGDKGAEALASALKHNGALTELDLSYNSIGKKGGVAIGHALLCNRTLEILNLGGNAIGDEGAIGLATGLRGGSSLKELLVTESKIGKKGGLALGEALAFCPTLERLDMNENPIGDEGAIAIASSLVRNATLKVLLLYNIGMKTEGCSALARALRSNASLTHIDVCCNRVGADGVAALAAALKENMSLKTLLMRFSNIGDEGAIALAEAIASNATLDSLDLDRNFDITEEIGIAALVNGLNRNSTLTKLYLHADHTDVKFALRRNKALSKEPAWMKRFSDQDIRVKGKVLSKAMERYSMSEFSELTFLFLKNQVSTIVETNAHTHPATSE